MAFNHRQIPNLSSDPLLMSVGYGVIVKSGGFSFFQVLRTPGFVGVDAVLDGLAMRFGGGLGAAAPGAVVSSIYIVNLSGMQCTANRYET